MANTTVIGAEDGLIVYDTGDTKEEAEHIRNAIQNPLVGIANQAQRAMAKILVEFGMTPSSRSRVTVAEKEHYSGRDFKWSR